MGIHVGGTRKASASVLKEVESIQMKGKMQYKDTRMRNP
jgi:hypothetical protein